MAQGFDEMMALYKASVRKAPALMMENLQVDANRGVTSRGNSPYDKFSSPETRAKVLESRLQEIEAFARSRNIPASNIYALAEAAMRTGKIPDLGQFGLAGDDAVATKQFLISNVLNIAGLEWVDYKGDPVEEDDLDEEAVATSERAQQDIEKKRAKEIADRMSEIEGKPISVDHPTVRDLVRQHMVKHYSMPGRLAADVELDPSKAVIEGDEDGGSRAKTLRRRRTKKTVGGYEFTEEATPEDNVDKAVGTLGAKVKAKAGRVIKFPQKAPPEPEPPVTAAKRPQFKVTQMPQVQKLAADCAFDPRRYMAEGSTSIRKLMAKGDVQHAGTRPQFTGHTPTEGLTVKGRYHAHSRGERARDVARGATEPHSDAEAIRRSVAGDREHRQRTAASGNLTPEGKVPSGPKEEKRAMHARNQRTREWYTISPETERRRNLPERLRAFKERKGQTDDVNIDPRRYMAEGSIKTGSDKYRAREASRTSDPQYQDTPTTDIHGRPQGGSHFGHGYGSNLPRQSQFQAVVSQGSGPYSSQTPANKRDMENWAIRHAKHVEAQRAGRAAKAEKKEQQQSSVDIDPSRYMAEEGGPYRTGGAPEAAHLSPTRVSGGEVLANPQSYEKYDLLPKEVMSKLRSEIGDDVYSYTREDLFRLARSRGLLGTEEDVQFEDEGLDKAELSRKHAETRAARDRILMRRKHDATRDARQRILQQRADGRQAPQVEHDYQETAKQHGGKFVRYIQGNIGVYDFPSAGAAQRFAEHSTTRTTATPKVDGKRVFIDEPVMGESAHLGYGGNDRSAGSNGLSNSPGPTLSPWEEDEEEEKAKEKSVKEDKRSEADKILGIEPGDPRGESWPKLSPSMAQLLNLESCGVFRGPRGFHMDEPEPKKIEESTISAGMGGFIGGGMMGGMTGRSVALPSYDASYELPDDPEERIKVLNRMLSKHGLRDVEEDDTEEHFKSPTFRDDRYDDHPSRFMK